MAKVNENTRDEVKEIVLDFFAEECEIDKNEISEDSNIISDLDGDSLMFLELIEIFKKKYNLNHQLLKFDFDRLKKDLGNYTLTALIFFLIFAVFMSIINGVVYGIISGLIFAFFMTVFSNILNVKKINSEFQIEEKKFTKAYSEIKLNSDYEKAFEKISEILNEDEKIEKIEKNHKKGIIKARRGMSVLSRGENITIKIEQNNKGTNIYIKSEPSWPLQIIDYGKNYNNVYNLLKKIKIN